MANVWVERYQASIGLPPGIPDHIGSAAMLCTTYMLYDIIFYVHDYILYI